MEKKRDEKKPRRGSKAYFIEQMDMYQEQLSGCKISDTQYRHMCLAIAGCKMIVRGTHGYRQPKVKNTQP